MNEAIHKDQAKLLTLIDKLLADTITEAEHADLQDRLRGDAEAQEIYFRYVDLDTDLREVLLDEPTASPVQPIVRPTERVAGRRWLALAASLLLLASTAWWFGPGLPMNSGGDGEVILVQSAGGELFRDLLPAAGQPLRLNRQYALTAGMIELRFPSGAEAILQSPAVLEIAAADRLIVRRGQCSVHAPPGAEGFQVITPQTEVVDLGTRFSVAVDEVGDTEVQVVEGEAAVRSLAAPKDASVTLTERQARRFGGVKPEGPQEIAFQPKHYQRQLPDRVLGYRTDGPDGPLSSVSVQRGGAAREYAAAELIGVDVTHFLGGDNTHNLIVTPASSLPSGPDRLGILTSDLLLHTGLINLGGVEAPSGVASMPASDTTPGMAIRFREPVTNGPGPDVVFFEVQSVADPAAGDAFRVGPLRPKPGLGEFDVLRYDVALNSPAALPVPRFELIRFRRPVASLAQLLDEDYDRRIPPLTFHAIAAGIDLSDLGYAAGATAEGLFLQDAADDNHIVDPVFIAGLPAVESSLARSASEEKFALH